MGSLPIAAIVRGAPLHRPKIPWQKKIPSQDSSIGLVVVAGDKPVAVSVLHAIVAIHTRQQ